MSGEKMPLDRMARLLRAKQHELENAVQDNAVLSVHAVTADVALLYALLAELVESDLIRGLP